MVKRILSFAGQVLRVVIYARVSEDRRKGASCEEQTEDGHLDLADLAEELGCKVEIVAVEQDNDIGVSEYSKGTRKGWPKVLDLMRNGQVDMVWTFEHSRGDRKLEGYVEIRQACRDAGVLWRYGRRTYDMDDWQDRETTGNHAVKAEAESGQTSDRVSRATRRNAVKGRPHGRRLYGYRRIHDTTTGDLLRQEPEPSEAWVVQWIYTEYLAGHSVRQIRRALNATCVLLLAVGHHDAAPLRPATAIPGGERMHRQWTDQRVTKILRNQAYIGQRVHNGKVMDVQGWDPIIDPHRWEQVQARLDERSFVRQSATARLQTGVARCGKCRGKMGSQNDYRKKDGTKRKVYRCLPNFCVARDLDRLDAWVTTELLARIARTDPSAGDAEDPITIAARERVEILRAELNEAMQMCKQRDETGKRLLSVQSFAEMEADLLPQIEAAEREARARMVPLSVEVPDKPDALEDWWFGLAPDVRREVVAAYILEVTVLPVGKGNRIKDYADYTTIEWRR